MVRNRGPVVMLDACLEVSTVVERVGIWYDESDVPVEDIVILKLQSQVS